MKTTAIGIQFNVNDLDASYEVLGTSDNYSFQYELGKGSDLVDFEGEVAQKVISLHGNYGEFDVRIFAVSKIGIRSDFIESTIIINPPYFDGTFTFANLEVSNIRGDDTYSSRVIEAPSGVGDDLVMFSEFPGKNINLEWSLSPPPGHALEGKIVSSELLSDTLFDHFSISIKTGDPAVAVSNSNLANSAALKKILSSEDVTGTLDNYRDFTLNIDPTVFNDSYLNFGRNVSFEIVAHDAFDNTCTGILSGVNYPPQVESFLYSLQGTEAGFSWDTNASDLESVNISFLAIPSSEELEFPEDLLKSKQYLDECRSAITWSNIPNINYVSGDKVVYSENLYKCILDHNSTSTSIDPTNTTYWTNIGKQYDYLFDQTNVGENFASFMQLWGYSYYYTFQAVDSFGPGEIFNLTEDGLVDTSFDDAEIDKTLFALTPELKINNLRFREREDDLIFDWDIVDQDGEDVDLEQYKVSFTTSDVPSVLGVSGSLYNPDTNLFLTGITQGDKSRTKVVEDGEESIAYDLPNAKIFNTFEYNRPLNNELFKSQGFPEGWEYFDNTKLYDTGSYVVYGENDFLFVSIRDASNALNAGVSASYARPEYEEWDASRTYNSSTSAPWSDIFEFGNKLYVTNQKFGPDSSAVKGLFDYTLSYNAGDIVISPSSPEIEFYNIDEDYFVGDVVLYENGLYRSLDYQPSGDSVDPDSDRTKWKLLSPFEDVGCSYYEANVNVSAQSSIPSQDAVNWAFKDPSSLSQFSLYADEYEYPVQNWSEFQNFESGSFVVYANDIWSGVSGSGPDTETGAIIPSSENSSVWVNNIGGQDFSTSNQAGDIVFSQGNLYQCLQSNPTGAPILAISNSGDLIYSNYTDSQWEPFWELDEQYDNLVFGHVGIPESGKRKVGLEVGIVSNDGVIINSDRIIGINPEPSILDNGFTVDSFSEVTKTKFNFNYAFGAQEKTTKVQLYRSNVSNFSILDNDGLPGTEAPTFVKQVLGAADATFGKNINSIVDDDPPVGDEITGYYYKILPFDDFGSGDLYHVNDFVKIYPKGFSNDDPSIPPGPISENLRDNYVPGPVIDFNGSTAFENYFLNWDAPNTTIGYPDLIPRDIKYYEIWASHQSFLNFPSLNENLTIENNTGYHRIGEPLSSVGTIPYEDLDPGDGIGNAVNILNISADRPTNLEAIYTGLTNQRKYFWIRPVDHGGNKGPFTGAANFAGDDIEGLELILGQMKTTDIADFEQNITEAFPNVLSLVPNNPFFDNTALPIATHSPGSISWDRHFVYYNGTGYVIGEGETTDQFVYWSATGTNVSPLTEYQSGVLGLVGLNGEPLDNSTGNPLRNINYSGDYSTSSYHPAGEGTSIGTDELKPSLLGPEHDFIIARNAVGFATPMWHSFANATIGTAHIQNAAITNAKIHNLTADKIRSAEIYGQDIQVGGNNLSGQIRSAGFGGLNSRDTNGEIIQGFAVSGNGEFVFQTKQGKLYFQDDELTIEGNIRQKDGSDFTLMSLSCEPNYFDYVEDANGSLMPQDLTASSRISAYYRNSSIDADQVRFKITSPEGYEYISYTDHSNGKYDISGFKYDPTLTPSDPGFLVDGGFDAGIKKATAIFDVTGFDAMVNEQNASFLSSLIIFASGVEQGIEHTNSISLLSDGAPGPTGRSPIFRGIWSPGKDYIGLLDGANEAEDLRGDVVFATGDSNFYIAINNSGPSSVGAKDPDGGANSSYWKTFGAQFESVATDLLLAKDAIITRTLTMGEGDLNATNDYVGAGGIIKTVGKEYGNGVTGFFLGNTGSLLSGPNPQFDVGSDESYIRFNGQENKIELKGTLILNQNEGIGIDEDSVVGDNATFIGGGYENYIYDLENENYFSLASSIVAGAYNHITGRFSFIGNGFGNELGDSFSAIIGGYKNTIPTLETGVGDQGSNMIGIGIENTISGGTLQTILNGFENEISYTAYDELVGETGTLIYDPDNSWFADRILGNPNGADIQFIETESSSYIANSWFPSSGLLGSFNITHLYSSAENGFEHMMQGAWAFSLTFNKWVYFNDIQKEYIYKDALKESLTVYIKFDSSPGWYEIYRDFIHPSGELAYFDQPGAPTNLNKEGIVAYNYATSEFVGMCTSTANINSFYMSSFGDGINWTGI